MTKCTKCNGVFIEEEFENHDTDGRRWGSYDRMNLFPLPSFDKLSDDRIQPAKNHSSDEEEYRTIYLLFYLGR